MKREQTYKEELEELKDILYGRLISSPPGAVAGIAKQYAETLKELEELSPSQDEDDSLDELGKYRANRQSASNG